MKFQKTVLAIALAVSAMSVTAIAATTVPGEQLVNLYTYNDQGVEKDVYEIGGKIYTLDQGQYVLDSELTTESLKDTEKFKFKAGGLVATVTTPPVVGEPETDYDIDGRRNHVWSFSENTIVSSVGGSTDYIGQVTDELGNSYDAAGNLVTSDSNEVLTSQTQYMNAGHFHGSNGHNVGLYTGQVNTNEAKNEQLYQASALNAQGLTLLRSINLAALEENAVIETDFTTGTTTIKNTVAGTTIDRTPVEAYGTIVRDEDGVETDRNVNVIKFNGEYYTVGANGTDLTKTDASAVEGLVVVAGGAATGAFDAETTEQTYTSFVGAEKTTYGESTAKYSNASTITVGTTDTGTVLQEGDNFTVGTSGPTTSVQKSVSTGIVSTDADGNNTYGLVVGEKTTGPDGTVSKSTTVTADGVVTTGDVTIFAGSDKETTVGTFVENATSAVDAKVDAALDRVEQQTAGINNRVSQLNSRVDDVEKTAYRGVAIALAAQQNVPNIKPGQFAVFGGVGHYESESAFAMGVVGSINERTSISGAIGVAGGSEVGGRVGVAYVFGGK